MYKGMMWYERQDDATKEKIKELMNQKKIYVEASNKRADEKAQQRLEKENLEGKATAARKLF